MVNTPVPNPAHAHDLHPPRGLLMACGALILFTVLAVGISRLAGAGHVTDWRAMSVQSRALVFSDAANGGIAVRDPATGAVAGAWAPETGGFVRTAMRSLALERRQLGLGAEAPFVLHRTASGRLIIEDPETSAWVSLDAFGSDNAAEFGKLLPAQGAAS
jgi:putative photosynthetic complex assembly protein